MTQLGYPDEYVVALRTRGGGTRVAMIGDITELTWTRALSATSEATVTIAPRGEGCRDLLNSITPWAHELAIWRDGVPVWEGPVWDADDNGTAVTITARDVTQHLTKRMVHDGYDTEGETADVAALAARMLRDAYGPDDPDVLRHLWWQRAKATAERYVDPDTVTAIADLGELVALGLEWTVLNRRIMLFGRDPLGQLPALHGEHFAAPLPIAEVGAVVITRAIVEGPGGRGEAGGIHPVLGLLEELVTGVEAIESEEQAAERAKLALYTPALIISGAVPLTGRAPLSITDLLPGMGVSVSGAGAALRVDDAHMILTKVAVTWGVNGEVVTPSFVEATDRTIPPQVAE